MSPDQKSNQLKSPPRFPWALVSFWLVSTYLIATSIIAALTTASNWSELEYMLVVDPQFKLYSILLGLSMKFICGILIILRSRWILIFMPMWIGVFVYTFLPIKTFNSLPSGLFLGIGIQACILSFVLWAYGRGQLK